MTNPRMMEYQYKEIIAQLSLLQLHDEDPKCPCTFSAGELNEYCIPKHLLTISALASESASMEDNPDTKKLLFGIQEEAQKLHEDTKKTIICKKGQFTPGIADWARRARKSLEPIYYACGLKTPKVKVADPGHTLTADNVIHHVAFEPNREKVVAAYIGPKREVVGLSTVATGTAHSAPLPVDKVVRQAHAHNAEGIVLMHNHPSGTTEISEDDRNATRVLKDAAAGMWVEHQVKGTSVARVASPETTTIKIAGACKGKAACTIAVKGTETVTRTTSSASGLKQVIDQVDTEMKARKGAPPNPNTFAIGPSLVKYQFRFEVHEAHDLVVSHNYKTFADTPGYPAGLQPRLRTRAAQVLQVQNIAANLDPDSLLVDFHSIEKGAPIIGKNDNVVECGNGRVMAIHLAAADHPAKFAAYKAALVKLAPSIGIDPGTVSKMKEPILVKRRLTDTDRAAFAQECNASTTIAPSAIETARTDAKLITMENITSLDIAEGQGIEAALRSPKNKAFTTSFLSKLPKNDQARLVDKDGQLNQEGVRRMTLALFLAAFHGDGGLRLAERSFEETEESVKNVLNGILRALGMLARAEQMAASGQRAPGLSISEDLAKVVAVYGQIKNTPGMTVAKYLAQSQMLERQLNPFQERLLSEIDKRARSAKAIGAMLNLYALNVEQAPPPQQGGMMGMEITVTKDDLFSKALRTLAEEEAAEAAEKVAREARRQGKTLLEVSEPKAEKVKEINAVIQRTPFAVLHGARAELLPDGRIEYSIVEKTRSGREYRAKASFSQILNLLEGPDMRALKSKYGTKLSEPVKVGDMVTLMQPTLQGPKRRMGRVTRIMPDGKVEIKLQQGGYDVVAMSEVTALVSEVSEPKVRTAIRSPEYPPLRVSLTTRAQAVSLFRAGLVPPEPKEGEVLAQLQRPQKPGGAFQEYEKGDYIRHGDHDYVITKVAPPFKAKFGYMHEWLQYATLRPASEADRIAVAPERTKQTEESKQKLRRFFESPESPEESAQQPRLFDPMLQKYIDACNMTKDQMQAVWNVRPLRDFIMWATTIGKTQVCQAGMVDNVFQVTVSPKSTEHPEEVYRDISNRSKQVKGLREVAVFGSKDRVFTYTLAGEVSGTDLLGGKQFVESRAIRGESGKQVKLFERKPNPTITIAGRCKGPANCKLTVKATEAIAAGATPGDLSKAITQVQRRWSEEGGPELARVAEDDADNHPYSPKSPMHRYSLDFNDAASEEYDNTVSAAPTDDKIRAQAWKRFKQRRDAEYGPASESVREPSATTTRCRVIQQHDDGDQTEVDDMILKQALTYAIREWELAEPMFIAEDKFAHWREVRKELYDALHGVREPNVRDSMYKSWPKSDNPYEPKIKVGEYIRLDAATASRVIGYGPVNDGTGRTGYLLANGVILPFRETNKPKRHPNVRDPLLASIAALCKSGVCVSEPKK